VCTGGGFDLALACDRIVAADTATFSHPGVRRGLVTGWGARSACPLRAARRWPAAPWSPAPRSAAAS
jgi:enoyl-CoA hydratase/carnithine racemase